MDRLELIVELIKEVKEDVKEVKVDQKATEQHLAKIAPEVELNRKDLELHMAQTRAVKELAMTVRDEANTRIEKIEKKLTVGHLFKLILSGAGAVGTIAGAIYGVSRIL